MGFWQWYRGFAPRTRMMAGVAIIAWGGVGMYLTDKAEERYGLVPTEQDKEELDRVLPKFHFVDREKKL